MSYAQAARHYLSGWISYLLTAVPPRSRATFVELLCGCLVSYEGWVTRAIGAITRRKHWTTYCKLLERGQVRTLRLAHSLFELVCKVLPMNIINLVIDDTLIPRQSLKAPGSAIRHDHAKKNNRPQYLLSQCWVTLGISVLSRCGRKIVLPILSRSVPLTGNRNKLTIALALVRGIRSATDKPIRILFDAWFMRARLVLPLLSRGIRVIRSGTARHGALHAACAAGEARAGKAPEIRGEIDTRCDSGLADAGNQTGAVWQGTIDTDAFGDRSGTLSQGHAR